MQKWPYMFATCRTLRLEEASWLDPGMREHSCKEKPLILTKEPDTDLSHLADDALFCNQVEVVLLYTEVRNKKGGAEEHYIAKDGGLLPSPLRKSRRIMNPVFDSMDQV